MHKLYTLSALSLVLFVLVISTDAFAQSTGISDGTLTTEPNEQAVLDVMSTKRGLLIPRTDTASVNAEGTPPVSMLIYQTADSSFYFYEGTRWMSLSVNDRSGSTSDLFSDTDSDTRIEVEHSSDDDHIRLTANGRDVMTIDSIGRVGIGTSSPSSELEVLKIHIDPGSADDQTNFTDAFSFAATASGGLDKHEAFDDKANTNWFIYATSGWIQYDFGEGVKKVIDKYTLLGAPSGSAAHRPDDWTLQGSNDGINFTVLDTRTGEGNNLSNSVATVYEGFGNTTAYRYYRMDITKNNGATTIFLTELELIQTQDYVYTTASFQVDDGSVTIADEYTLPDTDGTDGQVLETDGSGNVSWFPRARPTRAGNRWPGTAVDSRRAPRAAQTVSAGNRRLGQRKLVRHSRRAAHRR